MLKKYWQAAKIGWANGFVYRLNFVMWRLRTILGLLVVYFLWWTISEQHANVFGYEQKIILTYVLGTSLLRSFVFSSQSISAQNEISTGDLNNYLIKPIGYFRYWFFRDFADKALNVIFSVVEIGLLFLLLRPPVFIQTSPVTLIQFGLISILAMVLYYFFSMIVSMTTFWWVEYNGWPQRFLIFTILETFSGGLFPLDILPTPVFEVLKYLPTSYFMFTPLQVYLGRISGVEVAFSVLVMFGWIVGLWILARWMWRRGIKVYEAYGR